MITNQLINNNQSLIYITVTIFLLTMFNLLGLIDDKINLKPTSKTLYLAIVFICVAPIYQNFVLTTLELLSIPKQTNRFIEKFNIFYVFVFFYFF